MPKSTTIIAFDQHAATTVAAVLLPGQRTPALHTLTSDSPDDSALRRAPPAPGPVQLLLRSRPVWLRAPARPHRPRRSRVTSSRPALIPRRPGDRVKTDRRDAGQLAVLYRAGALTAIHIPTEQEEAARDLLRCREDIRADLLRARHRLSKFLLRHGRRFTATKKAWTKRHAAWLQAQRWPLPALEQTHRAYVRAVDEAVGRLQAVDTELRDLLTIEPLRARVERLRCFRGIDDLTALTIAAELGDARRFPSAPRRDGLYRPRARPNTPAAPNRPAARSPKPAMPICAACSSNPPGITAITRFVGRALRLRQRGAPRRRHRSRLARPASACIAAIAGSPPAANRSNTSSPPSPASSPAFSGPR